jgi:hypothetical protein
MVNNLVQNHPPTIHATPPPLAPERVRHPQLLPGLPFSPVPHYVRLMELYDRIAAKRRRDERPYLESPERDEVLSDLEAWFELLPGGIKEMDLKVLNKPDLGILKGGSPDDDRNLLLAVV